MMASLGRIMAYQRPFRARVASSGLLAVAPVSVAFLLLTLVVSALWHDPAGGHRAVTACCAWRATDLPRGSLLPLLGSAVLVRRPVEAAWTVAATWLVLGPLEAVVGSRRLLAVAILGHAIPTVLIDLCWLTGARAGQGLAGLDVGTSAVVVTAAAALAVSTGSLPLAAVLATCLAVDIAAAPDMATAEHLVAVAIGIGGALALRLWPRPRHDRTPLPLTAVALPRRGPPHRPAVGLTLRSTVEATYRRLLVEPGRVLVARAGALAAKVLAVKPRPAGRTVVVDTGGDALVARHRERPGRICSPGGPDRARRLEIGAPVAAAARPPSTAHQARGSPGL